jgi:hypothetical protein
MDRIQRIVDIAASNHPPKPIWISHYKHMPLVQIPMKGLEGVNSAGGRWNYA